MHLIIFVERINDRWENRKQRKSNFTGLIKYPAIQTQVYLAYMLSTVLNLLYWPWARFWSFVKCGAGRSNYQEEIVLFWCSMLIRLKFLQMKPLPVSPKILILIVTLCVLLTKPFAFCCANYLLAPAFLFTNPRHISSLSFHLTVLNLMIS